MIRGVIFDLDGTLLDSIGVYTEAFNRGIGKWGHKPVSQEEIASFLNRAASLAEILWTIFPFLSDEEVSAYKREILKAYLDLEKEKVFLQPGAREVLRELREMGLRVGVVTGRATKGEEKWMELRRLEVDHLIEVMITGAEAARKPSPEGIIRCLEILNLSPGECVFVGDSEADIEMGKAAGVLTVVIPKGVASLEALKKREPDMILSRLEELPLWIRSSSRDHPS